MHMDGPEDMLSEISQSQEDRYCDSTYVRHLDYAKSEEQSGCQCLGGAGMRSWCLMGTVSVLQDEKVLEMDGGDGGTLLVYLIPWNCILTNG